MEGRRAHAKPVLVAGGAGFLGSHLVWRLLETGRRVIVVDQRPAGTGPFAHVPLPDGLTVHYGVDVAQLALSEIEPLETIFYFCAQAFVPTNTRNFTGAWDANVGTLGQFLHRNRYTEWPTVVYASTGEVYGNVPKGRRAVENAPSKWDNVGNPYVTTRRDADAQFTELMLRLGINGIIVRVFNTFGPNPTHPYFIGEVTRQLSVAPVIYHGNLNTVRDFVPWTHTTEVFLAASQWRPKDWRGNALPVFNSCSGTGYTMGEVARMLAAICRPGEEIQFVNESDRTRTHDLECLVGSPDKTAHELGLRVTEPLFGSLSRFITDPQNANALWSPETEVPASTLRAGPRASDVRNVFGVTTGNQPVRAGLSGTTVPVCSTDPLTIYCLAKSSDGLTIRTRDSHPRQPPVTYDRPMQPLLRNAARISREARWERLPRRVSTIHPPREMFPEGEEGPEARRSANIGYVKHLLSRGLVREGEIAISNDGLDVLLRPGFEPKVRLLSLQQRGNVVEVKIAPTTFRAHITGSPLAGAIAVSCVLFTTEPDGSSYILLGVRPHHVLHLSYPACLETTGGYLAGRFRGATAQSPRSTVLADVDNAAVVDQVHAEYLEELGLTPQQIGAVTIVGIGGDGLLPHYEIMCMAQSPLSQHELAPDLAEHLQRHHTQDAALDSPGSPRGDVPTSVAFIPATFESVGRATSQILGPGPTTQWGNLLAAMRLRHPGEAADQWFLAGVQAIAANFARMNRAVRMHLSELRDQDHGQWEYPGPRNPHGFAHTIPPYGQGLPGAMESLAGAFTLDSAIGGVRTGHPLPAWEDEYTELAEATPTTPIGLPPPTVPPPRVQVMLRWHIHAKAHLENTHWFLGPRTAELKRRILDVAAPYDFAAVTLDQAVRISIDAARHCHALNLDGGIHGWPATLHHLANRESDPLYHDGIRMSALLILRLLTDDEQLITAAFDRLAGELILPRDTASAKPYRGDPDFALLSDIAATPLRWREHLGRLQRANGSRRQSWCVDHVPNGMQSTAFDLRMERLFPPATLQ